jgi:hypothetical protein
MTAIIRQNFSRLAKKSMLTSYSSVIEPKYSGVWKLGLGVLTAFQVR